jgi:AcrR family transcriptional regulator
MHKNLGISFLLRQAGKGVYDVYMTTSQRIFQTAKAQFESGGLAGLSLRSVARTVGVTPMAIYRHYPGKDALLEALMRDGLAVWENRVGAITARDPLEWLEELCDEFLAFALTDPRGYEAAFLLPASGARRYPEDFAAGRSPVMSMVYKRIEQARAAGRIGEAPAAEIGLAVAALAQGLVSLYRADRFSGESQFRAAYLTATRHCLRSFLKNSPP